MFDLETAIATWRRAYEVNPTFCDEDLEELEGSLRDRIDVLRERMSEQEAFEIAIRRIGSLGKAETEYKKVYWGKLRRERRLADELIWRGSMFKNYFKVAVRNLLRQKSYSLLNIVGLSVGLACAFLIVLWIQDELSYDRFHEDGDRIYRVMRHVQFGGDQIYTQESVPWPLARVLREAYPEIEDVALITWEADLIFNRRERSTHENGLHAGPEFFDMFSWNMIRGESRGGLQDPTSIVISASLAARYFGSDWHQREDVIGETIHVVNRGDFTVTGIFDDVPSNSSLQFDFVLPLEDYLRRARGLDNWDNSNLRLFLRLHPGEDAMALNEKITHIQNEHIEGFRSDLFLQAYTDQHLYSAYEDGVLTISRIDYYIRMFAVVAFMIVLIAGINFINLSTARSMRRAREVGVRKAIGAGKRALVGQFMGESLLLVCIAFVLAMGFVASALPIFNTLTGKEVPVVALGGNTLLLFAGIGVSTALIAGTYPALYLSAFDAVKIFRGTFRLSGGSARLRKGLVIFQFAMSMLLIIGTVTVYQQIRYIHAKNLGLDRENVVYLRLEGSMQERFAAVKQELLGQPGVASVTAASSSPLDVSSSTHTASWPGKAADAEIEFHVLSVDFDFLEAMKMEVADGRDFDPSFGTDSVNFIINETARAVMGIDHGEQISVWNSETGTVVGVVKDFHMVSLYSEIKPTIIRLRPHNTSWLFLRTEPGQTPEALESLETVYNRFNPSYPFEYQFLDERFRQTYQSEVVIGNLAGYFTVVALFIACLGLFGLAAFTAQQRTKEIGVRKVFGATISNLVVLLSKGFIKLVIIACVVTTPLAYLLMNRWLDQFAYHIEISWGIFLVAGLAALLIAVLTVSYQSIRAALANPVKSLRYE